MFTFQIQIPIEHPSYAGHFPGNPIVPGALLLIWIRQHFINEFPGRRCELVRAKLLAPVYPGGVLKVDAFQVRDEISLTVMSDENRVVAKVNYHVGYAGGE